MFDLDLCLSPLLFEDAHNNSTVVVIDVVRASTSICVALMNGVSMIIPVMEIDDALEYRKNGYLISGERNGDKLEDFDFGNSPSEFISEKLRGNALAMTTTNGTRAIHTAISAKSVIIGAFINSDYLSEWLISKNSNVTLLCSGWMNKVNIEDTMVAGKICERLISSGVYRIKNDAVNISRIIYNQAGENLVDFILYNSPRMNRKRELLMNDLKFCFSGSQVHIIPVFRNGMIISETLL